MPPYTNYIYQLHTSLYQHSKRPSGAVPTNPTTTINGGKYGRKIKTYYNIIPKASPKFLAVDLRFQVCCQNWKSAATTPVIFENTNVLTAFFSLTAIPPLLHYWHYSGMFCNVSALLTHPSSPLWKTRIFKNPTKKSKKTQKLDKPPLLICYNLSADSKSMCCQIREVFLASCQVLCCNISPFHNSTGSQPHHPC